MPRPLFQRRALAIIALQALLFPLLLCCDNGRAQIIFSVTDLQTQVGNNTRAYIRTNVALSSLTNLLGHAGGPQRWDFSQPPALNEGIHRTDIVPQNDGDHGGAFPSATYAEREIGASDGVQSWRYYRINTNAGRLYYGIYQPVDLSLGVPPEVVFSNSTVDLPASIQYGQTWNRTVDWVQFVSVFAIDYHFTANAHVDAYGTLALPDVGEVPALRVKQLDTYETLFGFSFNTNYYWLAKGIGIAAQIIFHVDDFVLPGFERPYSNTVTRVFETRPWRVADLRVQRPADVAALDWRQETNTTGYRVEFLGNLNSTNWQLLAEPTSNVWSDPFSLTQAQQFFRVFVKP